MQCLESKTTHTPTYAAVLISFLLTALSISTSPTLKSFLIGMSFWLAP